MAWKKLSPYCYTQNGYFISKTGINEYERYTLFKGDERIETFLTSAEAVSKYKQLEGLKVN